MPRKVKEWSSDNHDATIPTSVKRRRWASQEIVEEEGQPGRATCILCSIPIDRVKGVLWEHLIPLWKQVSGQPSLHCETNIFPVHPHCATIKTTGEAKERAKENRIKNKSLGIQRAKKKIPTRKAEKSTQGKALHTKTNTPTLPPRNIYGAK